MILTDLKIRQEIKKLEGWLYLNGRLQKTYKFLDFTRAVLFLNKIVNPIEEQQSYPKIEIAYNQILVSLFNNMAGGITEREMAMAQEFDKLC